MKLNVAVVYGGRSTEHEVSVISALQAIENIDKEKYNVISIYMDKLGDFYYNKDNLLADSKNFKDIDTLLKKCVNVAFIKDKNKTYIKAIGTSFFANKVNIVVDVAFPVVHGTNVEDGNLQGFFHTLNLPVVGPDCLSAAVSMDKYVLKEYCKSIGVPVIDGIRFDKNDYKNIDKTIDNIERNIKYPVIVKPVNLGSSIGIKKASDREGLKDALDLAFSFANIVLVEKAIEEMREINCAVLGDKFDCECSALEEPFGNDEILSFADKYMSGMKGGKGAKVGTKISGVKATGTKGGMASLQRKVPADIDEESAKKIKEYAKKTFKYIGASGVARIDFIIDKKTGEIYENEINPIPGSLSFYLFEPIGLKYKDLLDKLIKIAIDNYRIEQKLNITFENNLLK